MDTRLRQAQRAPQRDVVLIWPSTDLPHYVRDMLMRLRDAYGIRVVAIKVRPGDVERMLHYIDLPDSEIPEMHRSFVSLLRQYGVREMPALIADGQLIATGEDVVDALRSLAHSPALV